MLIFHWCSHYTSLNIYTDLLGMVIAGHYKRRSTVQRGTVTLFQFACTAWTLTDEAGAENTSKWYCRLKNGHYSFIPTFPSNTSQRLFTVHSLIVCWSQQLGEKKDAGAVWSSMIQQTQHSQGRLSTEEMEGCCPYNKACIVMTMGLSQPPTLWEWSFCIDKKKSFILHMMLYKMALQWVSGK